MTEAAEIAALRQELTADPRRHIALPGTMNLRDVGGYPLAESDARNAGRRTRWRTLLRSDSLHHADASAGSELARLGLRTVVDLRTKAETKYAPSPMDHLASGGTQTRQISILGEGLREIPHDLLGIYEYVITKRGEALGAAVSALAAQRALPALVHCTAGKDRTGLVIGLTLAVVGVRDDYIAADYSLTSVYLDPGHTPVMTQLEKVAGLNEGVPAAILESPAWLMLDCLALVRDRYGSAGQYLRQHGVTEADLAGLRAALTEPAGND